MTFFLINPVGDARHTDPENQNDSSGIPTMNFEFATATRIIFGAKDDDTESIIQGGPGQNYMAGSGGLF